ncbi:MAG: hydroxyacyl-ACP dehydratase HTD2-like protein with hotdog domain [Gammaproteobacteria bacterium]
MTAKRTDIQVGESLPERIHRASNVSLFLYNAAVWNAHRIHYDETYTTQVEKHPGIVIDGPLQGDWLTQTVQEWIGDDGRMVEFEYSNRLAAYLGEVLTSGGTVSSIVGNVVTVDVFIRNETGQVISPGSAVVYLSS